MKKILFIIFFITWSSIALAAPTLNFSDLINGPRTGNGDGVGSGVIVTIWGNNLGSTQGGSTITVGGVAPAHIYYWKNADGTLPGGPSDLYTQHKMQEVCFSLGATTPTGSQNIVVTVGGVASNALTFNVASSGSIYFVKPTGNDGAAGTWVAPWLTMQKAFNGATLNAGDTVYFVGSSTSSSQPIRAMNGTANNLINFAAYPNSTARSTVGGMGGNNFSNEATYVTLSKFFASDNDNPFSIMPHSRIIGCEATQVSCAEGGAGMYYCWKTECEGSAFLGNYGHDFGCAITSNQQHATYFTGRDGSVLSAPFEFGWNYLRDNTARMGIHVYDEHACMSIHGGATKIHDNFVVNQVQHCINIVAWNCDSGYSFDAQTEFDVYNNVCINTGIAGGTSDSSAAIWIGADGGSNFATHKIYNNTIYAYSDAGCSDISCSALYLGIGFPGGFVPFAGKVYWQNNVVVDTHNIPFFTVNNGSGYTPEQNGHNLWYYTGGNKSAPSWDASPIINTNPLFTNVSTSDFSLQSGSPAKDTGITVSMVGSDFLGISRPQGSLYDIGAFEYASGGGASPASSLFYGGNCSGCSLR